MGRWLAVVPDELGDGAHPEPLGLSIAPQYSHRRDRATSLTEVWNVFGNGSGSIPLALKAYADLHAYHRWETTPSSFCTLVGDASEDHIGLGGVQRRCRISCRVTASTRSYEGAPEESDQYYAEITRDAPGISRSTISSDIFVGRLAVNDAG